MIKNRMYGNSGAEYNHVGGITLDSATGLRKRYSFKELEANNFAESLLIPEGMIAMLMHKLYEDRKIVEYPGKIHHKQDEIPSQNRRSQTVHEICSRIRDRRNRSFRKGLS